MVGPVCTSAGPESSEDLLKEKFWFGPEVLLGGAVKRAPMHRAKSPGSNPGPGENFSLKLTTQMEMLGLSELETSNIRVLFL